MLIAATTKKDLCVKFSVKAGAPNARWHADKVGASPTCVQTKWDTEIKLCNGGAVRQPLFRPTTVVQTSYKMCQWRY